MAFAHQRSLDPTCSCERGPAQAKRVSILKDLTLKKGDVVVLDAGAKVFNGAERWPYKSRDFSDLKGSKTLGVVAQKQIERVVGVAPPDTARRSLRGRGKSARSRAGERGAAGGRGDRIGAGRGRAKGARDLLGKRPLHRPGGRHRRPALSVRGAAGDERARTFPGLKRTRSASANAI